MLKKTSDKKKKNPSNANLLVRVHEKSDKINLKFALNMLLPKTRAILVSPKHNDHSRGGRLGTATPKQRGSRKNLKQNGYHTTGVSHCPSHLATPLEAEAHSPRQPTRFDYKFVYQVGSGGFGRVWKVQQKKSHQLYAMKQISKAKVLIKKSVASVVNEKTILDHLSNGFIINMRSAFQDRQFLYMVMEYLRGGDLRYHLCFYEFFNEEQTKFIAACIVLGLEYTHSQGIIHRDLKPENLVFEESGYLRITDFGVARKKKENNSEETSGTPGYMAPEVICRMNHSYQADFFALGVIVYQMMLGCRPYMGDSRKEIRDKILAHQAKVSGKELPHGWSPQALDFVNRLIKRNKESRLGFKGIEEIKGHPWLAGMNWRKLARKQLVPPFVPGVVTESAEYQKEMENTSQTMPNQESEMLLRTTEIQNLFKDYNEKRRKNVRG